MTRVLSGLRGDEGRSEERKQEDGCPDGEDCDECGEQCAPFRRRFIDEGLVWISSCWAVMTLAMTFSPFWRNRARHQRNRSDRSHSGGANGWAVSLRFRLRLSEILRGLAKATATLS